MAEKAAAESVVDNVVSKHHHTHEHKYNEDIENRKDKRDFMQHAWKPLAATVYLLICLFDFIIAPSYLGTNRVPLAEVVKQLKGLDASVQTHVIQQERRSWEPLTLRGGGLFHLAFGAILTGVAVVGHRGIGTNKPSGPVA